MKRGKAKGRFLFQTGIFPSTPQGVACLELSDNTCGGFELSILTVYMSNKNFQVVSGPAI